MSSTSAFDQLAGKQFRLHIHLEMISVADRNGNGMCVCVWADEERGQAAVAQWHRWGGEPTSHQYKAVHRWLVQSLSNQP